MAKKLSFLMSFVLLVAIASNAFGEVIKWTDGDPCDQLWNTPGNWDLNRVPSIAAADSAQIVLQEPNGCIIDSSHTDANAAETRNLRVGIHGTAGDLTMTDGYLKVSNTAKVGQDASGRFYMHGGTARVIETIVIGTKESGNGSMTMTGGSLTTTQGFIRVGYAGGTGTLNMYGGSIDIAENTLQLGQSGGTGNLNMQGGSIDIAEHLNIGKTQPIPYTGTGILTMTGGVISIDGKLNIGLEGSTGHLQLDGGTIYADNLRMESDGSIDIKAGTLIIDGNSIDVIAGYINDPNHWITADDGNGTVVMDYNIRNPDKTTLTAISGDANLPRLTINVEPNDIGIDSIIPPITEPIYYWQDQLIGIGAGPSKLKCPYVYRFHHWVGDVADPCSLSTTVVMDQDKTITAVYFKDENRRCGDECHPILQGDLNADCYVNFEDFALYADQWLSCTHPDCDEL